MPLYNVTVYRTRYVTVHEEAEVEVEAGSPEEAKRLAKQTADADDDDLPWEEIDSYEDQAREPAEAYGAEPIEYYEPIEEE